MTDKIVNSQNSSYVPIVPATQTEFTENSQMILELDESLGYIKGRDSYLSVDVVNTSADFTAWGFHNGVGASSLIKRLEIYSRSTGQLLETLDNYNQWCSVETQHLRDDYSNLERQEGVGTPSFQYVNGYTASGNEFRNQVQLDPTKIANRLVSQATPSCEPRYFTRRFCIPIKSGIFSRWWDDEKLCPVLNFGGLRMVFTFAPNEEVCKRLGYAAQLPADNRVGLIRSVESVGIKCLDQDPLALDAFSTDETSEEGYFTSIDQLGLVVGNLITVDYTGGGGGTITHAITKIETTATLGRIKITCDTPSAPALTGVGYMKATPTTPPSYKVENCELRVLKMVVPKDGMDKLAKPMKYEFTSYDQFQNTIPTSVLRHQVPINSVASKGKAVFSHFENPSSTHTTYYAGLGASELKTNSLQLFINNKLYPLQKINPQKTQDKPLMLNELVKGLRAIRKTPLNLGSNEKGQLDDYSNTFLYSRELARGDFVYPLLNAEPELRMGFSAIRTHNVRVNTYVFSKKVVDVSPQGLMVEL
jgi:hypothetical protein